MSCKRRGNLIPAQRLFEKLGYTRTGMVENLDEGDPEIFYFKRLR